MKIGAIIPQGWTGEYDGWDPERAWERTKMLAVQAEEEGFESIWVFDHFHTTPDPTDELTFESFTTLTALAMLTRRVRLGHIVLCASFRNPALTAKMFSTLDLVSGGRIEVGLGAGWKKEEWVAYGYGFPETRERLAVLRDTLEIVTRMFGPGRATYEGERARVEGAINLPKPLQQPRPRIMVGGNGRNVTWRLAARYADELNLDSLDPEATAEALPIVRQRCEEIGRDPGTLPVSVHIWSGSDWANGERPGQQRVDLLGAYRELGVSRVMMLLRSAAESDEALPAFAEDARSAGVELEAVVA